MSYMQQSMGNAYSKTHNGGATDVTIYPRTFSFEDALEVTHKSLLYMDKTRQDGWFSTDGSNEPRFLTIIEGVNDYLPYYSDYLNTGLIVGRNNGAVLRNKCGVGKFNRGVHTMDEGGVCTTEIEKNYWECLPKYMGTALQKKYGSRNIRNRVAGGQQAVSLYTPEIVGNDIVEMIVEAFVKDNNKHLDYVVTEGDIYSDDDHKAPFDGLKKILWHNRKLSLTNHCMRYKILGDIKEDEVLVVQMGTKKGKLTFKNYFEDVSDGNGGTVRKLNLNKVYLALQSWLTNKPNPMNGKPRMDVRIVTKKNNTNEILCLEVTSTVARKAVPISDMYINKGPMEDEEEFSGDAWNPCPKKQKECGDCRIAKKQTNGIGEADVAVFCEYKPDLCDKNARLYFYECMCELDNHDFMGDLKSELQLHVSREVMTMLRKGPTIQKTDGSTVTTRMSNIELAEYLEVGSIHTKPNQKGFEFIGSFPWNIIAGVNTREDVNTFEISVGKTGMVKPCGGTLKDHLIIEWKAQMGVDFMMFCYVITNMGGDCYPGDLLYEKPDQRKLQYEKLLRINKGSKPEIQIGEIIG